MEIVKPIIIVGTGRSGTTIFHRILAQYPHVTWFTKILEFFPDKPRLNRYLHYIMDVPLLGRLVKTKIKPGEVYPFWDYYYRGFSGTIRDLSPEDVTIKVKKDIRHAFQKLLSKKRHRLLIKITGWPRIGFLKEIFPDAKFINVIRDGRAVAYSLMNVP